jgi:hypothetical protein
MERTERKVKILSKHNNVFFSEEVDDFDELMDYRLTTT